MSLHITNDASLRRPGYDYAPDGMGWPKGLAPLIQWDHIDGPLLYTSDAGQHWLTYWERLKLWLSLTTIAEIDRRRRRDHGKGA